MIYATRFFKECPHPDDKQRKELGRRLGLVPLQVKFWFQNKRTQMKVIKYLSLSTTIHVYMYINEAEWYELNAVSTREK